MQKSGSGNQIGSRRKICSADVQGLKYFRALKPFLERLHDVGTERDKAQNRQLHMDQYCMLILIWLFTPIVDSLRGLQQVSDLDQLRQMASRMKMAIAMVPADQQAAFEYIVKKMNERIEQLESAEFE